MAVVFSVLPIYYGIFAVDLYRPVVVRDGKGKELAVEFALVLYKAEELNDSPRSERYTVGVLAICNVKRLEAALNLVQQEWKEHIVGSYKEGLVARNLIAKNQGDLV